MRPDILVVEEICLWAAVAAVLWFLGRRRDSRRLLVRGGVAAVLVLAAVVVAWKAEAARRSRVDLAILDNIPRLAMSEEGFVTSDACQSCHPEAFDSWHHSFHRSMTQRASVESVLGDFDDVKLRLKKEPFRLERRGDEFWAEMTDPDWQWELLDRQIDPAGRDDAPRGWRQVVMTTGSHHFQTYWIGSKHGRGLHNLPFAWIIAEERWIPRDEAFLRPPGMRRSYGRWNDNCIECHASGGVPDRHPENGIFDTQVAELGIACESCHGPGAEHIKANSNPLRRYRLRLTDEPDPTIVNPAKLSPRLSTHVCGQCHGFNVFRGKAFGQGLRFRPGDDLFETRLVMRGTDRNLDESEQTDWRMQQYHVKNQEEHFMRNRFWPDGMMRIAGREHNAMIESACFRKGEMSCLSCHSMHDYTDASDQLGDRMGDDEACLQCHQVYRSDLEEHTHHAAGSSGSRCYNCHMPHTVYGLLANVRSHWIDSPSVATTLESGRPNACNLCHLDRSLGWTNQYLKEWYDIPEAPLSEDQSRIAGSLLWLLSGHAQQRALMAWHMGWEAAQETSGTDWMVPYLGQLLIDPYSAIRFIASRSLKALPGSPLQKYNYLGSNKHLSQVRNDVINTWLKQASPPTEPRAQLLIDDSGKLDLEKFIRLIKSRDNTPLFLEE